VLRTVFAMAFAGLVLAAVAGTAQAAPIAPARGGYHGRTWRCNAGFVASMLARSLGAPEIAVGVGETAGAEYVAGDFSFLT
jgi:hypothetical protein